MRIRLTTDDLVPPFVRGTEWDVVESLGVSIKDAVSGTIAHIYDGEYEIIESDSESNMSENSESELSENLSDKLSRMNGEVDEQVRRANDLFQEALDKNNNRLIEKYLGAQDMPGVAVTLMRINIAQADAINALAAEVADLRKQAQEGTQQPAQAPETNAGG